MLEFYSIATVKLALAISNSILVNLLETSKTSGLYPLVKLFRKKEYRNGNR